MEQQRDGHLEDLLLAARERAGRARGACRRASGKRVISASMSARTRGVAARVGAHLQVLLHAHRGKVAAALRHVASSRAGARRPRSARRSPRRRAGSCPRCGLTMPNTVRSSVDLPAPLAPMIETISPARDRRPRRRAAPRSRRSRRGRPRAGACHAPRRSAAKVRLDDARDRGGSPPAAPRRSSGRGRARPRAGRCPSPRPCCARRAATVLPARWSARMCSFIWLIIVGLTAAAGSSSRMSSGSGMSAAAKARSLRWP